MKRELDTELDDRPQLCAYPGCRVITPGILCTKHRLQLAVLVDNDCRCGDAIDPRETTTAIDGTKNDDREPRALSHRD
jgi:hypothetical protein